MFFALNTVLSGWQLASLAGWWQLASLAGGFQLASLAERWGFGRLSHVSARFAR